MFHSARIKLTGWYLMIIMVISISFSGVIYQVLTSELERLSRQQQFRMERRFPNRQFVLPDGTRISPTLIIDQEILDDTKQRIFWTLVIINTAIFLISGTVGYFLAGRTLLPIQEMMDEQHRFVSDASHELRTPLTALKTTIEVYLREKKLSPQDMQGVLSDSLSQVNQLQALSDRLLRLARHDQRPGSYVREKVSVLEVLRESVKRISPLAHARSLSLEIEGEDVFVHADTEELIEVFVILLDNAVKYSSEGSHVYLKAKKTHRHAVVEVIDEGAGIQEDDLPHVFDRFYRADESRKKTGAHGHGLGLSIAKKIIGLHEGSIKIRSTLGVGTTVVIKLPRIKT